MGWPYGFSFVQKLASQSLDSVGKIAVKNESIGNQQLACLARD
jgi:hypothetical protein